MRSALIACICLLSTSAWAQSVVASRGSAAAVRDGTPPAVDYRIGPHDLLAITVLQAPELDTTARVSQLGDISVPLLGVVRVGGLTAHEIEVELEGRLRRQYIREPDVSVNVTELQSHAVSVTGAVQRPGVFQTHGTSSLIEVLSRAEGLAEDAGETIVIERRAAGEPDAAPPMEVNIKALMTAREPHLNVPIHPGDIIKVQRADVVYVLGEVRKPGAFSLNSHQTLTVLRALTLGEGAEWSAAKSRAVILRTTDDGQRIEVPVDISRILKSQDPDVRLMSQDVLFLPRSRTKAVLEFLGQILPIRFLDF